MHKATANDSTASYENITLLRRQIESVRLWSKCPTCSNDVIVIFKSHSRRARVTDEDRPKRHKRCADEGIGGNGVILRVPDSSDVTGGSSMHMEVEHVDILKTQLYQAELLVGHVQRHIDLVKATVRDGSTGPAHLADAVALHARLTDPPSASTAAGGSRSGTIRDAVERVVEGINAREEHIAGVRSVILLRSNPSNDVQLTDTASIPPTADDIVHVGLTPTDYADPLLFEVNLDHLKGATRSIRVTQATRIRYASVLRISGDIGGGVPCTCVREVCLYKIRGIMHTQISIHCQCHPSVSSRRCALAVTTTTRPGR
jgi:hypothetical protein